MIKKIFLILVPICLLLGCLCFLNSEKFYSEYWLQKKMHQYSGIELLENIDLSGEVLTYKFYHDASVDVEISVYEKGYLTVGINKWFKDNSSHKTYAFEIDKKEVNRLLIEFKNNYTESLFEYTEVHVGGIYYLMEYNGEKSIKVGFFNTEPEQDFVLLKNEMLRITEAILP